MVDYKDHAKTLILLAEAQSAEHDMREKIREVRNFLSKEDGQWEDQVVENMDNRPRYTFDKCGPIIDQIVGELVRSSFTVKIGPAGGDASIGTAKVMSGLVRNIESLSNATQIYNAAARRMVEVGLDGWRVVTDWVDQNSFDQDILVKRIGNFTDRVWFDPNAEEPDMSDAEYCFVLQSLTPAAYKAKFPKGDEKSVSIDNEHQTYFFKKDEVIVGEFLYKKAVSRELVLLSDGRVYEVNDEYLQIQDDLVAKGVQEVKRRTRKGFQVYSRLFDGTNWLKDKQELPFDYIPVVPSYGNFDVVENKVTYRGAINKIMDPQRVYNYAKSRQIEEGALAPRGKYWMTPDQVINKNSLATMNNNTDPVQFYKHVEGQPPPFWQNGGTTNPGLQQTALDASQDINAGAGLFSSNMGDSPQFQSGVAIDLQQDKGDNGTYKYFSAHELAINYTGRIILSAIPKVYDTRRTVQVLGEDGTSEQVTLKDRIVDQETGQFVEINDLTKGSYDLTVMIAPHFENRQQETVSAITEIARVDPSILELGSDILLKNIVAPGVDLIAERKRAQMVAAGVVPQGQLTDEEKKIVEAIQAQPPQPSPVEAAVIEQAQAQAAESMSRISEREAKLELKAIEIEQAQQKINASITKAAADQENKEAEIRVDNKKLRLDLQELRESLKTMKANTEKTQAETLKILKEATGSIEPGNVPAARRNENDNE